MVVVQVVVAVVHSQQERTAPVVAVPLWRRGVDSAGIEFVVEVVNVEIGSGLVEVTWVEMGCANVCLGYIVHMVRIFQELSRTDRLSGVVVGGNILH